MGCGLAGRSQAPTAQAHPSSTMTGLLSYAVLLLVGVLTGAHPLVERAAGPFLSQVDNGTWVIGNELWNLTQQRTYGVKLFYKERDLVGDAVGHYVSYSNYCSLHFPITCRLRLGC